MSPSLLTPREFQLKLETDLHALAQPLMGLQCRLEIGRLMQGELAARAAITESMAELDRVLLVVRRMQHTTALHAEALSGAEL